MFDIFKIDIWKVRISWHLKVIGYKVYLAITKESYLSNSIHIEANALALKALRKSLSKEYSNIVSHCDSVFAVWNILTSPKLQLPIQVEKEFSEDESEQRCYMVQGNDSLEIYSESQLDDDASPSSNDYIDANALNEELSIVCEKLIEKYQLLKKKN